jgi:hypothetical protein
MGATLDAPAHDDEATLGESLVRLLDGSGLDAHVGVTIQLVTVDDAGWPRIALLSVGEVVALDARALRLALWSSSRSTANLTRSAMGLLSVVEGGASHNIAIRATARGTDSTELADRAVFDARVLEVRRDEVPYAVLTAGITFSLPDPAPVLARWRRTVDALVAEHGWVR